MAPGIKKSLFSKPAFSRGTAAKVSSGATAIDLFSRADLSYRAFVEEEEDKRTERKNAKAARKATDSRDEDEVTDNARKRQRVSISSSDSSSEDESNHSRRSRTRSPTASPTLDPASRTKEPKASNNALKSQPNHEEPELPGNNRNAASTKSQRSEPEVVLVLSSSPTHDSEEIEPADMDEQEEDEHESDDEIAELARKAREAARKKQESQAEKAIHSFQANPSLAMQNDHFAEADTIPFIMINVESPLPGAESKTFKRRLDQRLRQVRLTWCEANGFSEEERKTIILMFRGKRVFDVNTPESLGICIDQQGEPYVRGDDPLALPERPGEIVMEAILEDLEEEYMSNWQREHGRVAAEDEHETTDDQPQAPDPAQKPVKIICRARDFPDFKVAVKMVTTVSRIQAAFAMQNGLLEGTEVFVMLDGEILDADATIADLDIEDMDVLDIQVKHP